MSALTQLVDLLKLMNPAATEAPPEAEEQEPAAPAQDALVDEDTSPSTPPKAEEAPAPTATPPDDMQARLAQLEARAERAEAAAALAQAGVDAALATHLLSLAYPDAGGPGADKSAQLLEIAKLSKRLAAPTISVGAGSAAPPKPSAAVKAVQGARQSRLARGD